MAQPDLANWRPAAMTKQAYRRPELSEFGTLREMTLNIVGTGHSDGAVNCGTDQTNMNCKTSGG
jgi:hypothetical protein